MVEHRGQRRWAAADGGPSVGALWAVVRTLEFNPCVISSHWKAEQVPDVIGFVPGGAPVTQLPLTLAVRNCAQGPVGPGLLTSQENMEVGLF